MASFIERVKGLQYPEGEYVVIGSGLLDVLGIRSAQDLDFVVSPKLYKTLRETGLYRIEHKYGDELLETDDIQLWQDWKADATFDVLIESAVIIDGVAFVNPDILIKRKTERGSPKDLEDIRLLKEYQNR